MSSYFHSTSQSCPILQIAGIIYICFVYFAAIAQVWINLHRQNVFYTVMLWKGSQVPQELGGRRRSHDEKGNQGVAGFRLTNILQLFSIYFFFSITLLYHFFSILLFTHDIYPHPRPAPTTHDLYPRPTTFSYTRVQAVQVREFKPLYRQKIVYKDP